ncbi:MAG: glycoside hydrolase family 78 protein [Eubacterium sp.]|nr:glycoside hydrolase family 78 protein [Eubacterium sp.]
MKKILDAEWIKSKVNNKDTVTDFFRTVDIKDGVKKAELLITAHGVFNAYINGEKVSDDVLMPGWTAYEKRLRVLSYEITDMLKAGENELKIGVGKGWFFHNSKNWGGKDLKPDETALICALTVTYNDGSEETVYSDKSWFTAKSNVVYNDIYNGESLDLRIKIRRKAPAVEIGYRKDILIPFEGEPVREYETFGAKELIVTPKGEQVIDFGQEVTGYIRFSADVPEGTEIVIRHFEMLDKDGNVYTENLRSAKATYTVISDGNPFTVKPLYTFYGYRYIQVIGLDRINKKDFKSISVCSDIKTTAGFLCSNELLNQFAHNVRWGQLGNFLDVPTDCPQRDERLGWTGDAAMFCRTAAINFNVRKFFDKWLNDLEADQLDDGSVPHVSPYFHKYWSGKDGFNSPAWSDAAIIVPWEMYTAYGDKKILESHYTLMKKWVDFMISECSKNGGLEFPWTTGGYGDWLSLEELDREEGVGSTDGGLIATAFMANGIKTLIKVNGILGYDSDVYLPVLEKTLEFFRSEYMENGRMKQDTQTAAVLAIVFGLTDNPGPVYAQLAENVRQHGRITTGFIGSTYILDALTEAGEDKLAVDLLLRKEYPSWLYAVTMGATTVWERWNGMYPDGHFANPAMNSFNHYAYGSVLSWVYRRLAGIMPVEAGYKKILFAPAPDDRITFVSADIDTDRGWAKIYYEKVSNGWKFEITVPENSEACAVIFGRNYALNIGNNRIFVEKQ